jgi:dipeptidyl aminopeptidase/acylaminoacyl peptidase
MLSARRHARVSCVLSALLIAAAFPAIAAKRPLTLADMDRWRSIQNQQLSRDGSFLAYAVFPQEGDGEVVIRNLKTGVEYRANAGVRPPSQPPEDDPDGRPTPRNVTIRFTQDLKFVVFSTFPTQEQARKEKANAKGGAAIISLRDGQVLAIPNVKSLQVPEKGPAIAIFHKEPPVVERSAQVPAAGPRRARTNPEEGSDLVIRDLASASERVIFDVAEASLSKDGKSLAFSKRSKKDEATNGVYWLNPTSSSEPVNAIAGKGKYSKLVWDERQSQIAFVIDREKTARIGVAARDANSVTEYLPQGLPEGYLFSDRGTLAFSKDGQRLYFGTAPKAPERPGSEKSDAPEERAVVDLWHWSDERIQPMQKVRANQERNRTFRAVLHLADRKFLQLADSSMTEVTLSEDGLWGIGVDDHEYRRMAEYDQRYSDSYLVNARTGERKVLAKKHTGSVTWSPDSKYALLFNGKDWSTISVPDGKSINLTNKLGVRFDNEDYDMAGTPPSYGAAGWTKDGQSVLVYDRFDIWQLKPDGSGAVNLTAGFGRKNNLQLRVVRLDTESRWLDSKEPVLLRAENLKTRESGFFRHRFGSTGAPEKIVMQARGFDPPVKAKEADVYLLAAHTFQESPDLMVTDASFSKLDKVTRANPQQEELLWGSAEMITYKNVDGVELSGLLFKPENFDPKKKYPLMVYLYERLSQTYHQFREPRPSNSLNVPMYTSNGYVVLLPDIVYKIGSPGSSALKCVLPAVQAVVDRGFINEQAIGIQGHSWGGYQIAYMITETNRFKAAAPGAVVANMTSAYNGIRYGPGLPRQFQYERTQSRIGGTLWEYPMRYLENSPVFKADRIQTPVLMMHNDADDAVPFTQGVEFYLALRRLGKEVYLFNYNGEPHNLRKRPNQKDYTTRMFEYFNHYLKGEPKPKWMERGIPYLERDLVPGPVSAPMAQPSGAGAGGIN